jgi:hypothetical protein
MSVDIGRGIWSPSLSTNTQEHTTTFQSPIPSCESVAALPPPSPAMMFVLLLFSFSRPYEAHDGHPFFRIASKRAIKVSPLALITFPL